MSVPGSLDHLHAALACIALMLAIVFQFQRTRFRALTESTTELKEELARIKAAPAEFHYRLERYDVLWFAAVSASILEKRIVSASPGLPHCAKCVLPLTSSQGITPWKCPACGSAYADSLGTLTVTDAIVRLALEQFRQSHRDYLGPA